MAYYHASLELFPADAHTAILVQPFHQVDDAVIVLVHVLVQLVSSVQIPVDPISLPVTCVVSLDHLTVHHVQSLCGLNVV